MLKKQIKFLFSKIFLIRISQNFLVVFGTMWLFIQSAVFFFPEQTTSHRALFFKLAVLGSCILSFILSFPKLVHNKIFKRANVEIAIKVGDLLAEMEHKGSNIVVGTNNRFSLKKDRYTGSRSGGKSIRAQIATKFYQGKSNLLDTDIIKFLSNKQLVDTLDEVYQAPIGEVSVVDINLKKIFFLINQESKRLGGLGNTNRKDLWISLCNLWDMIKEQGYNHPIAIPVLGSGLGRSPASRISVIQLILISFAIANREFSITRRLTIVINEQDYSPEEMSEAVNFIEALDL